MQNENASYKKPAYNLSFVVNETGIKADTLRAWERRYKLPKPERSEGGHRLYSDFDIQLVKWLQTKQFEGMSISKAVKLWNEVVSDGEDPLRDSEAVEDEFYKAKDRADTPHSPEDYRQRWVTSCLNFDGENAEKIINEAFGFFDIKVICFEIFQEGLVEIGDLWHKGKATVQQEHFASNLAIQRLNALIATSPKAIREERIVVATPPNEEHVISSLVLTLILRLTGLRVTYLGANVPQEGLEIMLKIIDPALVVMSSTHLGSLPGLFETANAMAKFGTPFSFGGRIFSEYDELRAKIAGHYLGNDLLASQNSIEKLLVSNPEKQEQILINSEFYESWKVFSKQKAIIESNVAELLLVPTDYLEFHRQFTTDNLETCLKLGFSEPLQGELKWASEYLDKDDSNSLSLIEYLTSYMQISEKELGDFGHPVQNWLKQALEFLV
jgi:DNA-binding transcriptional MerR regulator/methylmalonyl-CoA mutase cobalamin-binding subunit